MRIELKDIEIIRDAQAAIDLGQSGIAATGEDYKRCDRLAGAKMMEYVGECEIVDDDGHITGDCAACFAPTNDGRTLLEDYYGKSNPKITHAEEKP